MLGSVSLELREDIRTGDKNVLVIRPWLFSKSHKDTNEVTTDSRDKPGAPCGDREDPFE